MFDSPRFLWALVLVAGVAVYLVWRRRTRRDPALKFSSARLWQALPPSTWAKLAWLPDALRIAALALLVVALARPQQVGQALPDETEGIDIVVALDTSGSMLAADFQPRNRMAVAKRSIADFINERSVDRIGLVVFAGQAATWVPLTLDYSLLANLLDDVDVGMLPDGTAIGSALGTALNRLRESEAASRVIVLVTDGANTAGAGAITPKQAAQFAKELGVKVFTILIGRGGEVPFPAGQDMFGRPVFRNQVMRTDPVLLKSIADTTGGAAYVAKDSQELDEKLTEVLDTLERTRLENTISTVPKDELFPFFVLAGLALMALEALLSTTRLRRFP